MMHAKEIVTSRNNNRLQMEGCIAIQAYSKFGANFVSAELCSKHAAPSAGAGETAFCHFSPSGAHREGCQEGLPLPPEWIVLWNLHQSRRGLVVSIYRRRIFDCSTRSVYPKGTMRRADGVVHVPMRCGIFIATRVRNLEARGVTSMRKGGS